MALQSILDPYLSQDLVSAKVIKHLAVSIQSANRALNQDRDQKTNNCAKDDSDNEIPNSAIISLIIQLPYPALGVQDILKDTIKKKLLDLPALKKVKTEMNVELEAQEEIAIKISSKISAHLPQKGIKTLSNIKNIIAVASGKGGVGKSTTAVNLALAIQAEGARVGILDADIYGPSQPMILGMQSQSHPSSQSQSQPQSQSQSQPETDTQNKPKLRDDKRMEPILCYGLQTMSMGYLIDENTPMVWRGPMVSQALQQLLQETAWDNLDYLIVDLPPGTGDIQLTLAQKIPVSGVVIVTTPQEVALLDAKKAIRMFQKLDIAILGVVENMSVHVCSNCGHLESIFGVGGGRQLAQQYGLPLLAELPLEGQIREQSDQGRPCIVSDAEGKLAGLYKEMARRVTARLSLRPRDYSAAIPMVVN